jgi:fatty acid desaturase
LRKTFTDAGLLAVVGAIAVLQFGAFALLVPVGGAGTIALIALAALSAPLHYGLMHETMHGNLFRRPEWNRRAGRVLGATLGLSWEAMRFGHLAHHGFNRHPFDRPEYLAPGHRFGGAAPLYFAKLVIGNVLVYAGVPLLVLLPVAAMARIVAFAAAGDEASSVRTAALRAFSDPARRASVRADLAVTVLLFAIAAAAWSAHRWIFAGCVLARWSVLSLLDNAPHYGMPLTSGRDARNTALPRALSWLVLNQNFHGAHHQSPNLHWTDLPTAFRETRSSHDGAWLSAVLRQFRGPVALE